MWLKTQENSFWAKLVERVFYVLVKKNSKEAAVKANRETVEVGFKRVDTINGDRELFRIDIETKGFTNFFWSTR